MNARKRVHKLKRASTSVWHILYADISIVIITEAAATATESFITVPLLRTTRYNVAGKLKIPAFSSPNTVFDTLLPFSGCQFSLNSISSFCFIPPFLCLPLIFYDFSLFLSHYVRIIFIVFTSLYLR